MRESDFRQIVNEQKNWKSKNENELLRLDIARMRPLDTHAFVVCGIRRCGKSTLLRQYLRDCEENVLHVRFEDYRLAGFKLSDFALIDAILNEGRQTTLLFDEIQNVEGWEIYVRQKLDAGYKVFITGSNATLLSKELGTRLTGRHIRYELSPFTFQEFCAFMKLEETSESMEKYLIAGGFPEFLKTGDQRILNELIGDILTRDIAVRYGLKDVQALKILCDYLLQNIGNLVSPSRLTGMLNVRSPRTVLDYCGYLEDSFLIHLVPIHSYSQKNRELAPKKIYAVDNGICRVRMAADKKEFGHLLENTVYNLLRQTGGEVNYFQKKDRECDFILTSPTGEKQAIQVCWELTNDNREREEKGLMTAMETFSLKEGIIVTLRDKDRITCDAGTITVMPVSDFTRLIQEDSDGGRDACSGNGRFGEATLPG